MFSNNNKIQTTKIDNNMNQHKFSSKNKIYDTNKCDKRKRNFMSRIELAPYVNNRARDKFGIILYFCSNYNRFANFVNSTFVSIGDIVSNKDVKDNMMFYFIAIVMIIFILLFGLSYFYGTQYYNLSDNEISFTYDIIGNIKAVRDSVIDLKLTAIDVDHYLGKKDSQHSTEVETNQDDVLIHYLELFLFIIVDIFVASLFLISLATAVTSSSKKRQLTYMIARILLKVPKFNDFMLWMLGPLFGKLIVNLMVGMSELDAIHLILDEISNYFSNNKDDLSGDNNSPKSVYSHVTITTQYPSPNSDDEDFSDLPGLVFDDPSEQSSSDYQSNSPTKGTSDVILDESGTTSSEMTERTSNISSSINIANDQAKISQKEHPLFSEMDSDDLPNNENYSCSEIILKVVIGVTIVAVHYVFKNL